ncbi:MAG: T9SS type A sorting domain-containing protein [Calditrichaceae bacterium]|nr:T9SS type A sorting domain-containing protein [Calditrichaceae bacterium]MBN2709358.1 T9SS type A sorting domain-containing protein [Calditrichaceae bacterium]
MIYNIKLLVIFVFLMSIANAQYEGPVSPIESGYGATGPYNVSVISFPSPLWPDRNVEIFYPDNISLPVPGIFFSHGYGGNSSVYQQELLNHIASVGYAAVFSPYKTVLSTIDERYDMLFEGFKKAVEDYPHIIDSARIGFVGHSFGGGATPEMAYRGYAEHKWGANGKFMMILAPWYVWNINQTQLENFPEDVNMIVQLYDDDLTNDHRMGIDLFENIGIPDSIKDYMILFTDTVESYIYAADHSIPVQNSPNAVYNAYDYYAVFRLLDALADFSFTGNPEAKNIALGNGSPEQIQMGPFKPLLVTDDPVTFYPEERYTWPCDTILNPRRLFCSDFNPVSYSDKTPYTDSFVLMQNYPNPFNPEVRINFKLPESGIVKIQVFDIQGNLIKTLINESYTTGSYSVNWDGTNHQAQKVSSGIYICRLLLDNKFRKAVRLILNK